MKKNKYIFGIPLIKRKPKRSDKFPRSVNTKNPRPFEVKEEGAEEDSTHSLVQKKEPPKSMDQLYYEVVFGVPGAQDSTAEEGAEENELEEEGEIPADETKKERKKRLKRERKEAKRKKKEEKRMRKNGELPPIEEEDKEEGSTEEDPIGSARPPGKGTETAKADDF